MKPRLLVFVLLAVLSSEVFAASPRIRIGDVVLYRSKSPSDSEGEVREYLPSGESADHWTRRSAVRVLKDLNDPKAYLLDIAANITKAHPLARHQILQDQKTKELVLDFMTFSPEANLETYAEWNLVRARFVPGKGLVVYRYSLRIYDPGESAAEKINAERAKMIGPFGLASFEEQK